MNDSNLIIIQTLYNTEELGIDRRTGEAFHRQINGQWRNLADGGNPQMLEAISTIKASHPAFRNQQ